MIELNQPNQEYYLPPNTEREYRTKFKIPLGGVF